MLENHFCRMGALLETTKKGIPTEVKRSIRSPEIGLSSPPSRKVLLIAIGKNKMGKSMTPMCTRACFRTPRKVVERWAYPYPARSSAWKKTMQVFHTAGVPPRRGRIIFPIMGCTRNNSVALLNSVNA